MKKIFMIVLLVAVFAGFSNMANAQQSTFCIPGPTFDAQMCYNDTANPGQQVGAGTIFEILQSIGGFLIAAAGVIAGIIIVVAGLVYMSAGSNPTRATNAKTIFKNGVIGALILFAAGIIINTIILLATNWEGFFG